MYLHPLTYADHTAILLRFIVGQLVFIVGTKYPTLASHFSLYRVRSRCLRKGGMLLSSSAKQELLLGWKPTPSLYPSKGGLHMNTPAIGSIAIAAPSIA